MKVKNANKDVVTVFADGKSVILQPDETSEVEYAEGRKCVQEKGCVKVRGKEKVVKAVVEETVVEAVLKEIPEEAPVEEIPVVPKEVPKEKPKAKHTKKK